ncbi:hypothetical protein GFS24_00995 [Chitinophaga sp. SYP-B3965]|uniref:hypothetical protein n=1 Tax=Chitinophaga sp. SYP-B3965 TaxID=2663120 RepID=UPI001299828F|nr:hypothetical protein [Chitinophaga sp. SYP-B3965]MRG43666.1 hypothetical protein [Chitinophaga sp. SYP-B3965]
MSKELLTQFFVFANSLYQSASPGERIEDVVNVHSLEYQGDYGLEYELKPGVEESPELAEIIKNAALEAGFHHVKKM